MVGDRERIEQVVVNILSNAVKYTPSGGRIRLTAQRAGANHVRITVEDNGVGIPQNKLSEIFERFSQGENANNPHYQGTGIAGTFQRNSKPASRYHPCRKSGRQGAVFIVELLLDKDHYRPSEVDFYVSDTETAPAATDKKMVIDSEKEPEEELEIRRFITDSSAGRG